MTKQILSTLAPVLVLTPCLAIAAGPVEVYRGAGFGGAGPGGIAPIKLQDFKAPTVLIYQPPPPPPDLIRPITPVLDCSDSCDSRCGRNRSLPPGC